MKTVAISGGFDPLHAGHVRLINAAKKLGDTLIVIANNDNWLREKKGYVFMPEDERKEILESLAAVDKVVLTKHDVHPSDMSVCSELRELMPDTFANGGDRKEGNVPEYDTCHELGVEMIFNVGGNKIQSSSDLVREAETKMPEN